MRKKAKITALTLVLPMSFCFAFISSAPCAEKKQLLRQAARDNDVIVAVDAHAIDNIVEAKVTVRMHKNKPKIYNALIVGPGLGRLSIETKDVLLASLEEEESYPTLKKDKGFITFKKAEDEKSSGTLTRELLQFRVPRDRVMRGKRYRMWIQVVSLQRGGRKETFKFDLKNFPELISGESDKAEEK